MGRGVPAGGGSWENDGTCINHPWEMNLMSGEVGVMEGMD